MKKSTITSIIMVIIAIILIFNIVGGTADSMKDAGDSITDANNCSLTTDANGDEFYYNSTDKHCYNGTNGLTNDDWGIAGQYDLPLASMFGSSGIVFVVVMAMIIILAIGLVLRKVRG